MCHAGPLPSWCRKDAGPGWAPGHGGRGGAHRPWGTQAPGARAWAGSTPCEQSQIGAEGPQLHPHCPGCLPGRDPRLMPIGHRASKARRPSASPITTSRGPPAALTPREALGRFAPPPPAAVQVLPRAVGPPAPHPAGPPARLPARTRAARAPASALTRGTGQPARGWGQALPIITPEALPALLGAGRSPQGTRTGRGEEGPLAWWAGSTQRSTPEAPLDPHPQAAPSGPHATPPPPPS